ncbi:MAG: VOC family protein [Bacteroidota bacterium]
MAQVNPYLTFKGNCEEAFSFYKEAFGKEFTFIGRFKDMPPAPGGEPMSEEEGNLVMHVSLPISGETNLFGSDAPAAYQDHTVVGNNISISINAETKEEADTLFNSLSAGGTVTMPMDNTFWGAYFGMFTDKFGIAWMVNFDTQPKP